MKKLGLMLLLIFIFTAFVKADVAPDPGFKRVSLNLEIETKEELSDYRFFLDFYGEVREVEIKTGLNSIPSIGGGARYSSGTLWAVQRKELKDFPKNPTNHELSSLVHSLEEEFINGIKLLKHLFSHTVSETDTIQNPPYLLTRDAEKGLKVSRPGASGNQGGSGGGFNYSVDKGIWKLTPLGYIALVSFPTAAIFILGIWLFRRKGRKLNQ